MVEKIVESFENINPNSFTSMKKYVKYKLDIARYEKTLERMEINNPSLRNIN